MRRLVKLRAESWLGDGAGYILFVKWVTDKSAATPTVRL